MKNHTPGGFAIALAWPETRCKKSGAWYDVPMQWLGLCRNHYYKVGHAATVLVDPANGACYYFDFGRYHAPFGCGRVRDQETDHDLKIFTKAAFDKDWNIENIDTILTELVQNPSCHGTGLLLASYCPINFKKAFAKAKKLQENSPWKYGPFVWNGTNCSRFVRTVILAGMPKWNFSIKLGLPLTVSPTPLGNVRALDRIFLKTHEYQRDTSSTPAPIVYT